ncbi:MAG: LysR family transcriptional regulator [Rhodocyclaceae bacterium]|nr:LysR family transcriptional regulator [Rhodocyclaceae bacterium]
MDKELLEQLDAMALFALVVEQRGFSAAARRLGIAKSAVSKKIGRLERSLGVRLLNRTTRSMSLTEAGRAVYERAAQSIALAEEARSQVVNLSQEPRGQLRVTASVAFGKICLVPLLPEFLAAHPDIRVQLTLLDRLVDLAEEGFDLAIRLTRSPPEGVVAKPLMPIDYVVCSTPNYLAGRRIETPRDLAGLNCLCYGYRDFGNEWIFLQAGRRETIRVEGNVAVNSSEAVRDLLLAGVGIGLVARYAVAEDLRRGRLVPLLTDWQPQGPFGQRAYALWLPQFHLPPKIRVFVDFLAARLG